MAKFSIDTCSLIELCKDTRKSCFIEHFQKSEDVLFIAKAVQDEMNDDYQSIKDVAVLGDERYFTIGASTIGGSDKIRGSFCQYGVQKEEFNDSLNSFEVYSAERKAKGLDGMSSEEWLRRKLNQNDSVIIEKSLEFGCDYVISENGDLLRAKNTKCKIIRLDEFFNFLGSL